MKKVLFYGMTGKKMCFNHILLNALELHSKGAEVKIIFEGESVKLVKGFEDENQKLYRRAVEQGLVAGVCFACSKVMGVYEDIKDLGLKMLDDMSGHAGMQSYIDDGFAVISI